MKPVEDASAQLHEPIGDPLFRRARCNEAELTGGFGDAAMICDRRPISASSTASSTASKLQRRALRVPAVRGLRASNWSCWRSRYRIAGKKILFKIFFENNFFWKKKFSKIFLEIFLGKKFFWSKFFCRNFFWEKFFLAKNFFGHNFF